MFNAYHKLCVCMVLWATWFYVKVKVKAVAVIARRPCAHSFSLRCRKVFLDTKRTLWNWAYRGKDAKTCLQIICICWIFIGIASNYVTMNICSIGELRHKSEWTGFDCKSEHGCIGFKRNTILIDDNWCLFWQQVL